MSARSQVTLCAQGGGLAEDVTVDQFGSPERLCCEDVSFLDLKLQEEDVV
jgi:hypothetical protein